MTNHVHLLVSSASPSGLGDLMKALGQRYVQYANRTYRRSGTMWEGRFRSCLVQDDAYLLLCQRYIELNPVRARMVEHPADYHWSSYRANALGAESPLLTTHPVYEALGLTAQARQAAYRELFRYELEPGQVDALRAATNGNFVLGDARFQTQVAQALGRRVVPGVSGRPRKEREAEIRMVDSGTPDRAAKVFRVRLADNLRARARSPSWLASSSGKRKFIG